MKQKLNFISMKVRYYLFALALIFAGCNSNSIEKRFPVQKRYWTPEDYLNVVREIKYNTPEDIKYPNYADPESAIVVRKLVDKENFLVVVKDEQLGISHRNNFANEMFNAYRDLDELFTIYDRQDKYIYSEEMVDVIDWGLALQIHYFKLGNDDIKNDALDPESADVKRVCNSNIRSVINNFSNNLKILAKEEALNDNAKKKFANNVLQNFYDLKNTFPEGNFNGLITTIDKTISNIQSEEIKTSLQALKDYLGKSTSS